MCKKPALACLKLLISAFVKLPLTIGEKVFYVTNTGRNPELDELHTGSHAFR